MSISGRERAMLLVLCVFDVDQNAPFPVVHFIRYGLHHEGLLVALYLRIVHPQACSEGHPREP